MTKNIKNIAIAIVATLSIATAGAQTKQTAYGEKYDENFNLRYTRSEKVHTEISAGGHYSFGDIEAPGFDLQVARVYTPSKNFSWKYGGLVSGDITDHYGALMDINALVGAKLWWFGLDALVGAGQMGYTATTQNAQTVVNHYNSVWAFKAGAQAYLTIPLSKSVTFSVGARYLHSFKDEGSLNYNEPEGWSSELKAHADKLQAFASVNIKLYKEHQISGDNCWLGGVYGLYNLTEAKEGAGAGAELFHFKRTGAVMGRILGLYTEQTFGEDPVNSIGLKGGLQWLPSGADSPFILEVGAEAGMTELNKKEYAQTNSGSYTMTSSVTVPGLEGRGYIRANLHMNRVCLHVTGKLGYATAFGSEYTGSLDGTTSKLGGMTAQVAAGLTLSF